jgi:predicted esterase
MDTTHINTRHPVQIRQRLVLLLRVLAAAVSIVSLAGCAQSLPEQRTALAQSLAQSKGLSERPITTDTFTLLSFLSGVPDATNVLTVYIEGDGYAWIRGRYPSADPTPRNPLALRLAIAQPQGAVAYLARPCQYYKTINRSICDQSLWTSERFSEKVVHAMNQALDQIKEISGAREVVLVGYSGGARIALEIAARRKDITELVAVAGNMDPRAWTEALGLQPVAIANSNHDLIEATAQLKQLYFAGHKDMVVPTDLTIQFMSEFPGPQIPALYVIEANTHGCCWVEQWPMLWTNALRARENGYR